MFYIVVRGWGGGGGMGKMVWGGGVGWGSVRTFHRIHAVRQPTTPIEIQIISTCRHLVLKQMNMLGNHK